MTGALRDRDRAKVVGTRTFGKGLVQEVERLSNGGVLDLTVANYYLPGGETISTKGIKPQVRARGRPGHRPRRGAAGGARHAAFASCDEPRPGPADARLDQPMVAVLEKRGRFLVAEPLFGRGRGRRSSAAARAPATSCSWAGASAARACCAGSGGPTARATWWRA